MTYRIAILDDNAADLQRTEEMLSTYSAAHPEHELKTVCFTQAEPFMESVCRTGHDGAGAWAFDILLMDIYLPDGNGMNCARTLRENGYEGIIIFQSSSAEHAVEAYQVDARQYLLKPISPERFFAAMDRAAEELPKCRKKRGTQETAEPGVQPAGDSVPDQAHTYGHSFRFLIDTLRIKWNSRKNG